MYLHSYMQKKLTADLNVFSSFTTLSLSLEPKYVVSGMSTLSKYFMLVSSPLDRSLIKWPCISVSCSRELIGEESNIHGTQTLDYLKEPAETLGAKQL